MKQQLPGAPTVLKPDEEAAVTNWIIQVTDMGFPVTKKMITQSVTKLVTALDRPLKFRLGLPGRSWYEGFIKRHSVLKGKVLKTLNTARIDVTEEQLRTWFKQISQNIMKNNMQAVLEDPSRIFYCDESAYYIGPKGQAVLTRKDGKYVFNKFGYDEKDSLTLALGASADGKLMPTLAIFPCETIPNIEKYPETWSCGRSKNRWMTSENFYEYISNVFNPILSNENIKKPVIMFLDGHVSYLSLEVIEFCNRNGIILFALIPSSTRVTHPMDVAIFHHLQETWKKGVETWRTLNKRRMKREDFGPVLDQCIIETLTPEIIQNGFRQSGLFPFDEKAVDYSKISTTFT